MTTRVERMLNMVPWVIERPGVTLDEVATAFGTSVDTVRSELTDLMYCGPRLGGGWEFQLEIVDDRVTVTAADELRRPLRLRPDEALRLVLVLTAAQRIVGDDLPGLASALVKVRDAAGLDESATVAVVDDDHHLSTLREAIRDGHVVELDYLGRKDDTAQRRRVEPWRLDLTPDGQYLQAHDLDRDGHRVFRLDRIATVTVTQDPVTTAAPDELPPPAWVPDDDAVRAVLDLAGPGHYLGDYVRADVDRTADGVRHVELRTDALGWLAELVLAGGAAVTVVEPPELRDLVTRRARAGLAAHDRHRRH